MEGTVKHIVVDRGFGFISVQGGDDLFFHFKDLEPGLEWNDQLTQRRVTFTTETTVKGLRAKNIQAAD